MTEGSGGPVGHWAKPKATRRISTVPKGNGSPVGCPAKPEVTRRKGERQAQRPEGSCATTERPVTRTPTGREAGDD